MFASRTSHDVRAGRRPPVPGALRQEITPVVPAASRTLPVLPALATLLPGGALRRGTTTLVTGPAGSGATSLAVALLAQASRAGHWCAAIGVDDPGVVAMAELGLDLRRAVFIPRVQGDWAVAAAELLEGVEMILLKPPARVPHAAARQLAARARERRAALVVLGATSASWPVPVELVLEVESSRWQGVGLGDGHLSARTIEVRIEGRGAAREQHVALWLPSPRGEIALVERRA
jgi:hypothetical protein